MRNWILFFHIIAVIVWMGGSIYVEALMAAVGRSEDDSRLVGVFRKVGATNRRLFNIAGIATIVFGFWLVFIVPGWEFETVWITVGIIVATVAVVIDLFYSTPRIDRVEALVEDPEESNDAVPGLINQVLMAGHVRTGLLFVGVVFMVFKF
ncbi:MAG: DUF2269 family protein [Acidimicrobiia bacterium]